VGEEADPGAAPAASVFSGEADAAALCALMQE
jgi:hypothetical protein